MSTIMASRPKDSTLENFDYYGVPQRIPDHLEEFDTNLRTFTDSKDADALGFTVAVTAKDKDGLANILLSACETRGDNPDAVCHCLAPYYVIEPFNDKDEEKVLYRLCALVIDETGYHVSKIAKAIPGNIEITHEGGLGEGKGYRVVHVTFIVEIDPEFDLSKQGT